MKTEENILIVRTDRIGDVVLTIPLAELIKRAMPSACVSFLVREYTAPLLEGNRYIDEVLTTEQLFAGGFLAAVKTLRQKAFTAAVTVFPRPQMAALLFAAGISARIGSGYRWYSFMFNKKVFEHRKDARRHELEYNVNLLKPLGIAAEASPGNVVYGMRPDGKALERVSEKMALLLAGREQFVVVHPGSGGSAVDLPAASMHSIVERLSSEAEMPVIVTGLESEREICRSLVVNDNVHSVAGEFSLRELIALVSLSDAVIANSTGPLHIGAALGKWVIGFYPKITAASPERWAPYTERRVIYTPSIDCSGCTREQCREQQCMKSIDTEEVYAKILQILRV